eukprot:SM000052S17788  [mRNA]  locus=s52:594894:598379:+ [translate_table: standard]
MAVPRGSLDATVQGTNDDATISKLSCVKKGYFKDDFVHHFVRRPARRAPVINRGLKIHINTCPQMLHICCFLMAYHLMRDLKAGYYARWAAIRNLVEHFLEAQLPAGTEHLLPKQVISLGAGFDTTFFQLQKEGRAPYKYVEVDVQEVTSRKAFTISSHDDLLQGLGKDPVIHADKGELHSSLYHLIPVDLRDLQSLDSALVRAAVDVSLPTLILAECVLIYLEPQSSRNICKWAGEHFTTAAFVIYEQIRPHDPFGQQMLLNLESRGCPLLGIEDTPDLESKTRRFTTCGWKVAQAHDMDEIYSTLDATDLKRIERLELFDEFEEWHIMQEHYCIAYGFNDALGLFEDFGFKQKQAT